LDHGMDAYGWYDSFHAPGLQWGIYIPVTGILFLIRDALSKLPGSTRDQEATCISRNPQSRAFSLRDGLRHRAGGIAPPRTLVCPGQDSVQERDTGLLCHRGAAGKRLHAKSVSNDEAGALRGIRPSDQ